MEVTNKVLNNSTVKVFLADDHVVLRQALREALSAKPRFTVIGEASNGEELLAAVSRQIPDLIVLDLAMPKVDGVATLQALKARGMTIPILVLSADESERTVKVALQSGAKGFLPKHVGLSELEFAIDAVLQGQTYVSPSVTERLLSHNETSPNSASPLEALSDREQEILVLLANGTPNREIAKKLCISPRTVDTHRSNILRKLSVNSNAELVKIAITHRMIGV